MAGLLAALSGEFGSDEMVEEAVKSVASSESRRRCQLCELKETTESKVWRARL